MENILTIIKQFQPFNLQEQQDKELYLNKLQYEKNLLTRENPDYHFSASAWVLNNSYDKVLMVYHNIYDSYSWTGGHADGCPDLLKVAKMELEEETGLQEFHLLTPELFAFDILPVPEHIKHGKQIQAHHHINLTYLFAADDQQKLHIKADENSDVKWIAVNAIDEEVREEEMKVCYHKLTTKAALLLATRS